VCFNSCYLSCICNTFLFCLWRNRKPSQTELFKLLSKTKGSMITEFATRSGGATLPLRFREAKENIGISKEIYSFVLPLGSTINMDGAAIYMAISAIFIGTVVGAPLTLTQLMTLILTATFGSIGAYYTRWRCYNARFSS